MKTFSISNFGPIGHAEVTLGDLTVLTGPQASGKSLFPPGSRMELRA